MESGAGIAQHQRPRFAYLHHISLPCRDVEESKRFYTQVLGGELIHDIPGFAEVRIADMIFGMSRRDGADRGVPALGANWVFN
jgi:catechol 2,3-dioxygenase-like lactoylglutathione lyase family enzyme